MLWWHVIAYFLIAVLAGLGVGSGGLLIAFLALATDLPQGSAAGVNLIFIVAALAASVAVSIKNRKVSLKFLLAVAPAGMLGALCGSLLALKVPSDIVRNTFAVFMIIAGAGTLVSAANLLARAHREKRNKQK